MNRTDMIAAMRNLGYNYKFYKYSDAQIYRMHQRCVQKWREQNSSRSKSNNTVNLQDLFNSVYGRIKND